MPLNIDFSEPEHFDAVQAFYLPQHAVVHLARGTWHWGPYPLNANLRIFNIQGRGSRRTTESRGSAPATTA